MIETTVYSGELRLVGKDSYAASLFRAHSLPVPERAEFTVEYSHDDKAERVTYLYGGKPWGVLYRDGSAFAEVVSGVDRIVFRPLDERGGYTMLGFLLPPAKTDFFFRNRLAGATYEGDPCVSGSKDCVDYIVPFNFVGNDQVVRLSKQGTQSDNSVLGRPQTQWRFVLGQKGLPKSIAFTEWRNGIQVAAAKYAFVSTKTEQGSLNRLLIAPPNATRSTIMEVRRGTKAYGGVYDPNVRDVWAHYDQQERIWARVKHDRQPPYGIIALVLLVAVVAAWFGWSRLSPQARVCLQTPNSPLPSGGEGPGVRGESLESSLGGARKAALPSPLPLSPGGERGFETRPRRS